MRLSDVALYCSDLFPSAPPRCGLSSGSPGRPLRWATVAIMPTWARTVRGL